ncbi:MAG: glycosyltransferase [Chloroflexi bacterium]|nr:glycosyltransferase [Chloroflexota bacterium]
MRILYVTPYIPSLIRIRPYNFIKGLAKRGHSIHLLTLASGGELCHVDSVRPYCEHVDVVELSKQEIVGHLLEGLCAGLPLQVAYARSHRMEKLLLQKVAAKPPDVVHVEHLRASAFGLSIKGVPKVYDSVDCISLLWERAQKSSPQLATRLIARLELPRTRRYEGQLVSAYERVLITSNEDKAALEKLAISYTGSIGSDRIYVLANGIDLEYFAPQEVAREKETLVLTGKMSYHANVATAQHLCQEIMPLIWKERPTVRLWIVGQDPPASVRAFAQDERVQVTGYVPDLRPYLARATIAVSPIQYGVGIQNKVLEPMAMATPVVTSSQACKGVGAVPGRDLVTADSPANFAEQVLLLLDNAELRQRIGNNARQYVQQHHSWLAVAARLERIYQDLV